MTSQTTGSKRTQRVLSMALAVALAACGGGGDNPAPATGGAGGAGAGGGGGSSALTFASATPAAHNTTADPTTAASKGNDARAADGFSAQAYCDVFYEDFSAANSKRYALQVYFRQGDKQALHVSVIEATPGAPLWVAFNSNSGNPITGVAVDTTARTIVFSNKALSDTTSGGAVTLSGTVTFQANTGTPACGT
jgi:hypothetical protein